MIIHPYQYREHGEEPTDKEDEFRDVLLDVEDYIEQSNKIQASKASLNLLWF